MTNKPKVLVTPDLGDQERGILGEILSDIADLVYMNGLGTDTRATEFQGGAALIGLNLGREIGPGEEEHLGCLGFIQLLTAGVDPVPFSRLPAEVPVANNPGHQAAMMAEHGLALALACSRCLVKETQAMKAGHYKRHAKEVRGLAGGTCLILGYGGAGRASARLFGTLSMEIMAINRSGAVEDDVAFAGTLEDLETCLPKADLVLLSMALTKKTTGVMGGAQLALMKEDAILVNLARGALIDQAALYEHMKSHPDFSAGLDVWWVTPFADGEFRLDQPFFDLPNLVATPHISAKARGRPGTGLTQAAENLKRYLIGGTPRFLVREDEKLR